MKNRVGTTQFKNLSQIKSAISIAGSQKRLAENLGISERAIRFAVSRLIKQSQSEVTLLFSDTHIPYHRPNMLGFLSHMNEKWHPSRVYFGGDLLDIHSISRHDALPDLHSSGDEIELSIRYLRELTAIFPEVHMVLGNHDDRIAKQAARQGISSRCVRPLHDIYELPDTWTISLEEQVETIYGLATLIHGNDLSGVNASDKWRTRLQTSVIIGHVHSFASLRWYSGPFGKQFALNLPCLVDRESPAMEYAKAYGGCQTSGCVIINKDGILFEML